MAASTSGTDRYETHWLGSPGGAGGSVSITAGTGSLDVGYIRAVGGDEASAALSTALRRAARPLHRYRCAACGFEAEHYALSMQIGSSNVLFDDTTTNRTFRGQIDEFRIWSTARTETEIRCTRSISLEGKEPGLALYYLAGLALLRGDILPARALMEESLARSREA